MFTLFLVITFIGMLASMFYLNLQMNALENKYKKFISDLEKRYSNEINSGLPEKDSDPETQASEKS
ncbi:MAG: hypothetical protein HQK83_06445 [Fibrobacteria bacterium]|nr:hypothetical protein [Fibrobacteria bacterium]